MLAADSDTMPNCVAPMLIETCCSAVVATRLKRQNGESRFGVRRAIFNGGAGVIPFALAFISPMSVVRLMTCKPCEPLLDGPEYKSGRTPPN